MTDIKFKEGGSKYRMNVYAGIERNLRSYSGFTSLLKELIQNSDDSYTDGEGVEIGVYFLDEKLKFTNNTVFDENDWNQIEEIGSMNKDEDSKKTGRFGIGFTSVFKICDYLDIHSNNVSKRLSLEEVEYNWRTYEEPRIVGNNTEFEFFWRNKESEVSKKIKANKISRNERKDFIADTLTYIHQDIHFLQNVTRIVFYDENEKILQNIFIEKQNEDVDYGIKKETKIITITGEKETILERLIYYKNITDYFSDEYQKGVARREPLLLSIAINISKLQKGHIYCTLPTEEPTNLKFDINCDFQPDPNRKKLILKSKDENSEYNLKLLSFIPDLLYEILNDLKSNIPPQQFYEIISEASEIFNDNTIYSDNTFISKIQYENCKIIFIDDKWYPISETRIIDKIPILFLLKRMDYPIISDKFLKFKPFFDLIGVDQFSIQDLIWLIEDKIPNKISFDDSIFEYKDELKSVFKYLSNNSDYEDYISELGMLNIFLTMDGYLNNTSQIKIYNIPSSLKLIENDLDIDKIDKVIFDDLKDLLLMLGVQKFSSMHLIEMIYNDFNDQTYPLNLLQSKSYINSKDKIRKIIDFVIPDLKKYQQYNNNQLDQNIDEYNKLKKCDYLPLIVDDEDQLYPLKDSIYIYNLDFSDLKKRFASKYDILDVTIVHDIAHLLSDYDLLKSLTLDVIFVKVQEYIESGQPLEEDDLILLYELILEGESQLKQSNIKDIIETTPIFRNNDGELCSLINNGKKMKLIGSYTNPIKIKEILDEKLIKNIPDFKENILKRYFVEELTFEIYIKEHFKDVFENESVNTGQKLKLIEELNEQFLRIEDDLDIIEILKNTEFIHCQDNQFHHVDENNLFFKSDEIKNFFGNDYLHPKFHDVEKYTHLLNKIGLKKELKPSEIVNHVINLTGNDNIDTHLIKKLKNIFTYINKHWSNFQDKNEFEKLSDIEWLPAVNDDFRLYKPSNPNFYTLDTEMFLCMYDEDTIYLDFNKKIKQGFVDALKLKNIPEISTQMICLNLKFASGVQKHIDESTKIYIELNRRLKDRRYDQEIYLISELKLFPSIYIKYKNETPRYFKPTDIFVKDCHKKYGREYIDYLEPKLIDNCDGLIEFLGILEEPDGDKLKDILEKIDKKYENKGYLISLNDDKKIIENCLEQLNQSTNTFSQKFISELRRVHIFCNSKNELISPEETIIDDSPILSKEFEDQLGNHFLKYQSEKYDLIKKLNIERLSKIINKELEVKPELNQLKKEDNLTNKLHSLSKLMPRIKAEKGILDKSKWSDFDPNFVVYIFDKIRIRRYIKFGNTNYNSNNKNIQCYVERRNGKLVEMYVQNSNYNMKSIVQEIVEEIHPEFSNDFKIVIDSLLKKESYLEMDQMLTDFDYPVIDDKGNSANNILEDGKEFESDNNDFESNLDIEPPLDDSGGKTTQKCDAEIELSSDYNDDDITQKYEAHHSTHVNKKTSDKTDAEIGSFLDENGYKTTPKGDARYRDYINEIVSPDAAGKKPDDGITYPDITNDSRSDENKKIQHKEDIENAMQEIEEMKNKIHYQKKNGSSSIPKWLKQNLIQDYDGKCQICFEKILDKKKEPHMTIQRLVTPHKSNLGISEYGNLLALCPNCHLKLKENFPWSFINVGRVSDVPDFANVDYIEIDDRDYVCIKIKIAGEDMYIHYKQNHFDKFKYLYENY